MKAIFDWSCYTGNLTWISKNTIYLTKHGSHAYGTNIPTSDLDIRGIVIAPPEYYLGFLNKFEQADSKDPDFVVFDIKKFFQLACDANPNVLELLYTDESDHIFVSPQMRQLFDCRDQFLSKKAKHTFSGYAISQLKRINLHYKWLKSPPQSPPTRQEFGLPERTVIPKDQLAAAQSAINKKLSSWNLDGLEEIDPASRILIQEKMSEVLAEVKVSNDDSWVGAARMLGYNDNFIELLDKERRYNAKQKYWEHYQTWKKNRNPERAKLEEKFGYDSKHALHLIRLLRMCREILEQGKVIVKRHDAQELLEIRNGKLTYEELIEWADKEDKNLNEVVKTSKLPQQPNRKKLDQLCQKMILESFGV